MKRRGILQSLRSVLNVKVFDVPQWMQKYAPFGGHLFCAAVFLIMFPISMWQSWRIWNLSRSMLASTKPVTSTQPESDAVVWLGNLPYYFFGLSIVIGIIGLLFARAACRTWIKLHQARGFEIVQTQKKS